MLSLPNVLTHQIAARHCVPGVQNQTCMIAQQGVIDRIMICCNEDGMISADALRIQINRP